MNNTSTVRAPATNNSSLDLGYLSQFELDDPRLLDTDAPGAGTSGASTNMVSTLPPLDMLGATDTLPAPTPAATADAATTAAGSVGAGSSRSASRPALSPRVRPSTASVATAARGGGDGGDKTGDGRRGRLRATPHLPSGSADPAPPTTMYWSKAPVHGLLPARKFRAHTSTVVDHVAWVFGGCDEQACSRDVYCLDTETFQWSHPELAGDWPAPVRAHTATLVDKRIFVFGGGANADYYDTLYVLDTTQRRWSRIDIQGPRPLQRRAHTAVYYNRRIWVFGGGNGVKALNDVWAIDVHVPPEQMRWQEIRTIGKRPAARGYHTANLVNNKMVVVGGSDGRDCFADIWVLNLEDFEWTNVSLPVTHRRLSHCATQVGSYLFVLGGHDSQKFSNDLLLFNLITLQWEIRPCAGRPPSIRAYQTSFLTDSRLFVLGGYDGQNAFDDVHILDLAASAYLPQVTSFAMSSN